MGDGSATATFTLEGRLQLEVEQVDAGTAELLARLDKVSASAGLDADALEAPFRVKVDGDCRLLAFARGADTSRAVGRNQQSLLWETQFQATPTDTFRMENGNGRVEARIEPAGEGSLRRVLGAYASLWRDPRAADLPTQGVMQVRRSGTGWFDSVDAYESFVTKEARVDARLSLTAADASGVSFDARAKKEARYVWEDLLPYRHKDLIARPVTKFDKERQAKVAHLTPTQAVDQFVDRVKQKVGIQDVWPDLSAYFEAHPDAVDGAVARYRKGELPKEAGPDFFLALSKARVPEARAALYAIKRDERAPTMDRVRSMFALVTREDVGPELASELAIDAGNRMDSRDRSQRFLGGEAMLAVSMMSGTREDPQVGQIAQGAVRRALEKGTDDLQALRATFGAVGNLGDSTLLATARPYTTSPDPRVRRSAARVFGRMPPDEATPVALEWLRRETDPLVKRDLYGALQQENYGMGKGANRELVEQAIGDLGVMKTPYGRRAIVRLIAQSQVAKDPAVREALVRQAKWERAHHTPLLNEFQNILTPAEVGEVLR
jgi:hypothetical protein